MITRRSNRGKQAAVVADADEPRLERNPKKHKEDGPALADEIAIEMAEFQLTPAQHERYLRLQARRALRGRAALFFVCAPLHELDGPPVCVLQVCWVKDSSCGDAEHAIMRCGSSRRRARQTLRAPLLSTLPGRLLREHSGATLLGVCQCY
jgi:hypothetical protein